MNFRVAEGPRAPVPQGREYPGALSHFPPSSRNRIALSVLAQKGRVNPLIGPRSLSELNHSLDAFSIALSPGDVQWLRDGDPGQSSAA
ncbi:hypothetical protein CEJ86_26585 [Sinorhizobium meliloti]|uniref:Uncharacterized protein n=1 Tax=Rhizobium meliloti TaxID=382 RepID=A0A2J0YW33_RHIML|nr:hypothetical protein CEJ86_26585 [Sinorhizobium meliloti]